MATISLTARATEDLHRLFEFLVASDSTLAQETIHRIGEAIQILDRHPLMGRKVEHGLRELVISRGRAGYLALYRWHEQDDVVLVLVIRHQREAGYSDE
ncbi:MAG: type II toxin-antitoxin system RelE/ParE family toxin [Myxococcota bacterium]